MFRTIIFKTALATYFILWSPILLVGLINKKLCGWLVFHCAYGVLTVARIFGGIKYRVIFPQNEENDIPMIPNENHRLDGKVIIAAKHMSILEIAIISKVVRNTFFIMKRELLWIPIYGWAFWRMGMIGVNRAAGRTNLSKLSHQVENEILDGRILVIFPEGTRAKPGQQIQLKGGLLFLARHLKLPILPVGTDAGLYWPKHGRITPGTATITFEPILPSKASLDEISEAINRHSA